MSQIANCMCGGALVFREGHYHCEYGMECRYSGPFCGSRRCPLPKCGGGAPNTTLNAEFQSLRIIDGSPKQTVSVQPKCLDCGRCDAEMPMAMPPAA